MSTEPLWSHLLPGSLSRHARAAIGLPRRTAGHADACRNIAWAVLGVAIICITGLPAVSAQGQTEYSRPVTAAPQPDDIGADYEVPVGQHVPPRSSWWYLADVLLLVGALVLAAFVAHRWRRRWMAVAISVACLAYFGFFRQGCVCPIGAVQNVTAGIMDPSLAVPIAVLLFFLLPLAAALFVGRVFCSGVCPLGAIQDVVVVRPMQLPLAVDRWGGMLKYVYLGAAVWFAAQPAAARDFIICRYDPFVGMFRLSGVAWILILGGGLLLVGTVIGRPYCRFLCPYGGLLAVFSRYSARPVRITPDEELDCGLCAESCPFGAVRNMRADRANCFACARCFAHCPRQQYQWGEIELVDIENLTTSRGTNRPAPSEQPA